MSLGDNLKRLRTDKGMTQDDLSNESGVGLGQISKLEWNKAAPTLSTTYKQMKALDRSAGRRLMDKEKSGLSGILKEQFERVAGLLEADQVTLIKIMDKFCIANGLRAMLDEHRALIKTNRGETVENVL